MDFEAWPREANDIFGSHLSKIYQWIHLLILMMQMMNQESVILQGRVWGNFEATNSVRPKTRTSKEIRSEDNWHIESIDHPNTAKLDAKDPFIEKEKLRTRVTIIIEFREKLSKIWSTEL